MTEFVVLNTNVQLSRSSVADAFTPLGTGPVLQYSLAICIVYGTRGWRAALPKGILGVSGQWQVEYESPVCPGS